MDFLTSLMTKSTAELSNLEWAVGVVLLAVMGITAAFAFIRLINKVDEIARAREVRDWYENERWREDQ